MSEELKPCPFCSGPAEHDHDDHGYCWVQCRNCGVSTDTATHGNTDARVKLADMWNRRATLSPANVEDGEEVEVVEFDWPEYHHQGMGCGLENRGITDRYEAMKYGCACAEVFPAEPLMTVAQHERIVAALQSEVSRLKAAPSDAVSMPASTRIPERLIGAPDVEKMLVSIGMNGRVNYCHAQTIWNACVDAAYRYPGSGPRDAGSQDVWEHIS